MATKLSASMNVSAGIPSFLSVPNEEMAKLYRPLAPLSNELDWPANQWLGTASAAPPITNTLWHCTIEDILRFSRCAPKASVQKVPPSAATSVLAAVPSPRTTTPATIPMPYKGAPQPCDMSAVGGRELAARSVLQHNPLINATVLATLQSVKPLPSLPSPLGDRVAVVGKNDQRFESLTPAFPGPEKKLICKPKIVRAAPLTTSSFAAQHATNIVTRPDEPVSRPVMIFPRPVDIPSPLAATASPCTQKYLPLGDLALQSLGCRPEIPSALTPMMAKPQQAVAAEGRLLNAPPCQCPEPMKAWKRLRLKKGVKHYICRTCGSKWKVARLHCEDDN